MPRQGPRLHRLPQRLDYTLIPAPLDFSLPSITEKSSLPAIIVTPSSPVHNHDFSIAFLAPTPKPTFCERVVNSVNHIADNSWFAQSRSLRSLLILAFLFFIMITTHLITHHVSAYSYVRLNSDASHRRLTSDSTSNMLTAGPHPGISPDGENQAGIWHWIGFEFRRAWSVGGGVAVEDYLVIGGTALEQADSLTEVD